MLINHIDSLNSSLRFLASGDLMSSIAYAYRIERSTVSMIVAETCEALWEVLQDELLQPSSINWKKIAAEFEEQWNFPHCIGAIDNKHVIIKVNCESRHMMILRVILSSIIKIFFSVQIKVALYTIVTKDFTVLCSWLLSRHPINSCLLVLVRKVGIVIVEFF